MDANDAALSEEQAANPRQHSLCERSRLKRFGGLQRVSAGLAIVLAASIGQGCGGGGDAPLSTAQAQAAAKIEVAQIHFVLRPDPSGHWYVQNDVDHMPIGVDMSKGSGVGVDQFSDSLVVTFDRRYTFAGVIQITSDDDFRDRVSGFGNLGVTGTRIILVARGNQIDPSTIGTYVPAGAGNLWVTATMVNR